MLIDIGKICNFKIYFCKVKKKKKSGKYIILRYIFAK
jgi:hypothetical protein